MVALPSSSTPLLMSLVCKLQFLAQLCLHCVSVLLLARLSIQHWPAHSKARRICLLLLMKIINSKFENHVIFDCKTGWLMLIEMSRYFYMSSLSQLVRYWLHIWGKKIISLFIFFCLVSLQFYGYLSQQQNMMQDYVRTGTYQRAILQNHTDFKDKVTDCTFIS